ncbi:acetyl-coenzyme A transporter 1 [Pleuronectes platessa]|uniref:acetyl-coenzyme A transporter 1 n=1 Tax=Pleuronectes platessa TaxID=8262 RepID=UPI00232A1C70|nr:acetyl-coenzyme A transporter 1 [Pleuronectes platessa]
MEPSDVIAHKNGRQRKLGGSVPANVNIGDLNRGEMSGSEAEEEDEAEGLIRGSDSEGRRHAARPGIRGELGNVSLLLFLYVLQGIPLGLAGSIPLILQGKNVSYKDQAFFSFVFWPFSLKLLWAPLVDALYFSRFGRRKSWLVPTQYLLGLFMLYLSVTVEALLQSEGGPNVGILTAVFFMLAFLAATQDIAVDGWALTMLSRENVGYASTCNSVGQTAGYFLGNVLFLALESANFCNKYLRAEPKDTGIVTLSDFLFFWGVVFLISTTLVAVFKRETAHGKGKRRVPQEETKGVLETYKLLFTIIKMPTVFTFCALLLTAKIGFSAADAVTGLKLVEAGVPKEQLALLAVPMVPLQILLPVVISKYTAGPRPLDIFYKAFPFRLLIGLEYALLVWWTSSVKQDGGFPVYYYTIVLFSYAGHQVALYSMYVACMAFHAKVSDPLIGGTYMTLLNTVTNLGGNWPSTVALWMVDPLTSKACQGAVGQSCGSPEEAGLCVKEGGACVTTLDGYYVESVVCVVIGLAWWVWLGKKMRRLQEESPAAWRCRINQ